MPRSRALPLLLLLLLPAFPVEAGEGVVLAPKRAVGDAERVEVESSLRQRITLAMPSVSVHHTRLHEQRERRIFTDTVRELDEAGRVTAVERTYERRRKGERSSSAETLKLESDALEGRRLILRETRPAKETARPEVEVRDAKTGEAVSPPEPLRVTEPFELLLPTRAVKPGEGWTVKGPKLLALAGAGTDGVKAEAEATCKLTSVKNERPWPKRRPEGAAEPVATVAVTLTAKRTDAEGRTASFELKGTIRVAVKRRRLLAIELAGHATIRGERVEGEHRQTVQGRGKVSVQKWFNRPPAEDDDSGSGAKSSD